MADYPSQTEINLPLLAQGKVRDIYSIDDNRLLMVASDRVSAFDVILPCFIPGKGEMLTQISNFWFNKFKDLIPNHLTGLAVSDVLGNSDIAAKLEKRSMITRKLTPLPVEAIVRGYLIGSGWKDYQETGAVCGITLPSGLEQASQLPEPIYTPSTKADVGDHDMNVDYAKTVELIGEDIAAQVRDTAIEIYKQAAEYAASRGIIIADTKFEFGLDDDGTLYLIDEVLTPDSSRFWPADTWKPGISPPSYDKQIIRDYLETLDWDKSEPGPVLPDDVLERSAAKYQEALDRLMT